MLSKQIETNDLQIYAKQMEAMAGAPREQQTFVGKKPLPLYAQYKQMNKPIVN